MRTRISFTLAAGNFLKSIIDRAKDAFTPVDNSVMAHDVPTETSDTPDIRARSLGR